MTSLRTERDLKAQRAALLAWYDAEGRQLPWRVRPEDRARGVEADPYRVWLSEIMLQQTTVAAASPYYERFLSRFETVEALAAASLDDVLALWAGLGYYARARNLHACAREVAALGAFPDTEEALLRLPGIGAYTAAAIAAVCFDRPANVVDGNVERVIARQFAVDEPLPKAKKTLRGLAAPIADPGRAGDYAQAIMDLGAVVCTPTSPDCDTCPWERWCEGRKSGDPTQFPVKAAKKPKPRRYGVAFVLRRNGCVWLRQRPPKGLLGGMSEFPGSPWRDAVWERSEALRHAPSSARWRLSGSDVVRHTFSHFHLELQVMTADASDKTVLEHGWWANIDRLSDEALPSVMSKVAVAAGLIT